jgi:hypothetical protein
MSRLILPQFKDVRTGEVDRSLDVEEIDAAFARVAKALNGGLTEENFAPGLKFAIGATASTVQSAWAESKAIVDLVGQATNDDGNLAAGVTAMVIGGTGVSTWTPLSVWGLLLSDANAPVVTFYYGASALTAAITATQVAPEDYGVTSSKTPYVFSGTAFLQTSISANTLIHLTSTRALYGASSVRVSLSAPHL